MDVKEIQDLLKLINKSDLTEVEIEKEGFRLKIIRKAPENIIMGSAPVTYTIPTQNNQPAYAGLSDEKFRPSSEDKGDDSKMYIFRSPMIGTFYRSSSPDNPPYVKVGDQVKKGQVVGIIEAMKLFNEIESEVEGKVVKIMVENAQPVEFDQPLIIIDPNA